MAAAKPSTGCVVSGTPTTSRERRRDYKRRLRATQRAAGLTCRGTRRSRPFTERSPGRTKKAGKQQAKLVRANARQAWVYWLKVKAPAWWLDAYYLATGKRWNDPRISAGKKYAIRYAADEAFYHKEYARLQAKKIRERSQLGRKAGGMSAANTKAIRMAGTHCHYCHTQLELRQRTLDHVVPLIKGGLHQSFNVVVACRSCNSRKGSR